MFSTAGLVRRLIGVVALASAVCLQPPIRGAEAPAAALFRIFLTDGSSLLSFGEFARVADRVVFSVPLGEGPEPRLHVVSIPQSAVNWAKTDEYAAAVRARRYAETRGEQEFAALADRVATALHDIAQTNDPKRRVAMAEAARSTLVAWPAANHGYRAADVAQLVGMLDDVVAEMRIAAGDNRFDLSLVAASLPLPAVPLLPAPDVRGSLETAFRAARLAADPDEKIALLQLLTEQLSYAPGSAGWAEVLRVRAGAALAAERRVDSAYAGLVTDSLRGAAERAARADVRGLQQIIEQVLSADDRLGRQRPGQVTSLLATLDARLNEARRLRLARDSWASRAGLFRGYRAAVKKPRERIAGIRKWVSHIRDLSGPDRAVLPRMDDHAATAQREFARVKPPAELEGAHGLFVAAVHMTRQAVTLRRKAIAANDLKLAWDASAAASGALTLWHSASDELNRVLSEPSASR